jgi:formamidopyrimidine-DNA glycosylase
VPELPEVETMRRNIERLLVGRTLSGYELRLPKLLRESPMPSLDPLVGQTLIQVRRRAKVLLLEFGDGLTLAMHCKLSGQITITAPAVDPLMAGHPIPKLEEGYPHKTTHLIFTFTDGSVFYYSDLRQFGWARLGTQEAIAEMVASMSFGPEGIDDESFNDQILIDGLRRRRIPVKTALLDQQLVAGLGNIYVDEALHRARIHPSTPANEVDAARIPALLEAISWSLGEGLKQGGAKIINNKAFPIDDFPAVHAREGEPCPACGTAILKVRVGQRGTYLCPVCQPLPAGVTPPPPAGRRKATSDPDS